MTFDKTKATVVKAAFLPPALVTRLDETCSMVDWDALTEAERATAAEQGRIQRERFLTPGTGYQPGNAQMFNGNN